MAFKRTITGKEYIKFVLPSIVVMVSLSVYMIIDGYFVATYVGSDALAAMNLIMPLNSVIHAVALMFTAGGGALISIKLGENDKKSASQYFSTLLTVAVTLSIVAAVGCYIFQDTLLNFLGVNESLYAYAGVYSNYIIGALPLLILNIFFADFLRAGGKPKASMVMGLLGGMANVILDYLFIVILDMGIAGAGLGTVLGIVSALVYGVRYYRSSSAVFTYTLCPIDWRLLKNTMANGSSEMVGELAVGYTTWLLNILCLKYAGTDGVAAISVILYINFFVSCIYIGLSIGTAPLLSYHYGAKNQQTLQSIMGYAQKMLLFISPIAVAFIWLFSPNLVSVFIDASALAHKHAIQGLYVFAFSLLLVGYNLYNSAMFTAFSNGKISAVISFSKTFIFISLGAVILPPLFGLKGVWLVVPMAELVTAVMVFYLTREKQLRRLVNLDFSSAAPTDGLAPSSSPQN
jgi:putative MATE family efflux protein